MAAVPLDILVDAAAKAGFSGDDLVTAVAVAMGEWGGTPSFGNNAGLNNDGTVDHGPWQINDVHKPDPQRADTDVYYNAQLARQVFDRQGWSAWVAYDNGAFQQHWDAAVQAVQQFGGGLPDLPGVGAEVGSVYDTPVQAAQAAAQTRDAAVPFNARRTLFASLTSLSDKIRERATQNDEDKDPVGDVVAEVNTLLRGLYGPDSQPVVEFGGDTSANPQGQTPDGLHVSGLPPLARDVVPGRDGVPAGLKPNAARGAAYVREVFGFGGAIGGVGERSTTSDHPHGNAIDVMTLANVALGQQIADFFVTYAAELGVKYVIFNKRIASANNGWEWEAYTHPSGGSNPTLDHVDHPHISFYGPE